MKLLAVTATLLCAGFTSANLLHLRQDSSTASTSTSASSSVTSSAVSESSTQSPSSSSTDGGISISLDPTATGSSSVSSTGTASIVPSPTSTSNGGCSQQQAEEFHTQGNSSGLVALCGIEGGNNTVFVGDSKRIQWWTGAFNTTGATVTMFLKWMDGTNKVEWQDQQPAWQGASLLTVNDSNIHGGNSAFYRMVLSEAEPGGNPTESEGPIVTILVKNTTPAPPPPTSFNVLGLAVGLPVGLAVVAGILLVFCCMTKKHRGVFAGIKLPTRRKGYGVGQSRRQRTGNAVDEFDFDASAPIYRDQPGEDYASSTRDERSARAMGVFSAERNLHSTH